MMVQGRAWGNPLNLRPRTLPGRRKGGEERLVSPCPHIVLIVTLQVNNVSECVCVRKRDPTLDKTDTIIDENGR